MDIFGLTWTASELVQAVSAVLTFATLVVLALSLSVTRGQIKQSVRPLLSPDNQNFTLFCSPDISGYFSAYPFHTDGEGHQERGGLFLRMSVKNLGIGPATSVKIEWQNVSRSLLKSEAEKLCDGKSVEIGVHEYGLEIKQGDGFKAFYTMGNRFHTVDYIPANSHSHALEEVYFPVPPEVTILMLSHFERVSNDARFMQMARDLKIKVVVKCKDVSGRNATKRYVVSPRLFQAQWGKNERMYQGSLEVSSFRFFPWV